MDSEQHVHQGSDEYQFVAHNMTDPAEKKGLSQYTIRVNMRGHSTNYSLDLVPVQVWAPSLAEALRVASQMSLGDFFPAERCLG